MTRLEVIAIEGLPEIARGDDLAAILAAGAQAAGGFAAGDVLVVAHKIVSKAEGAVVDLRRSGRPRGRASWPTSTARTRARCRSCSTRAPQSCAPSAAS